MRNSVIRGVVSVILTLSLLVPMLATSVPVAAQQLPLTPTNPRPGSTSAPGPVLSSKTVTLQWDASSGATRYALGARNRNTGVLEVNTWVYGTSHTVTLNPNTPYQWNVAAWNEAGYSSFTTLRFFQTPSDVSTPLTPTNPRPGSMTAPGPVLSSKTVTLQWDASSGATRYALGVRNRNTNVLEVDTWVYGTSHTVTLNPNTSYQWNVAAWNDAGYSSFTTLRYFQTPIDVSPPATPTNPRPGSTSPPGPVLLSKTVTLEWDSSPGATRYALGVRNRNTNVLEVDTWVYVTSHTVTLNPNTPYQWNVAAWNDAGYSLFTTLRYFQTPNGVSPPLVLECDVSPDPTEVGHETDFLADAAGGFPPYSWLWTVNGIGVATTQSTTYTFFTPGKYTICVTVTDFGGNNNQCCTMVTTNEAPYRLVLLPETDANLVGTTHPLIATAYDQYDNVMEGVNLAWSITGVGSFFGTPEGVTDANGEANAIITSSVPGISTVICEVTGTLVFDTATKIWVTVVPNTWYVDDDLVDYPAADFTRIQDAVDAASPGDTIIVYPGTYIENVDVNKDHLTIQSENGADSTVVQAANPGDHVFEVRTDYVNISGFTVRGATGSQKAGIFFSSADHCNISDNIASNNYHGIYLSNASSNNTLIGNSASDNQEGIFLVDSSGNILIGNSASNNVNGIYLHYSSINNTLTSNMVSNNQGGISISYSSNNNLRNNIVTNNSVFGISLVYSGNNTLRDNTVSNNDHGIHLSNTSCNNTLRGNIVLNNRHGIHLFSSNDNTIYLNNFITNTYNAVSPYSTNTWNSPEPITYTYSGKTYTSYLGNYWSDYTGSDADGDGIGETLYPIDSDADTYPLVVPFENYVMGPVPPEEWSFAIITDLHIGRGYLDYGGEGVGPEDWQVEGQDYYLTDRLHRTVDWIIQNQDNYDLKFVIVLGDISDSGEYSELKKAKDILDELNDAGIPYVPMIGNHDVLPYTEDEEFEHIRYFEFVFEEQFESLMEDPSFNLIKQPAPEPYDPHDLQSYAFSYGDIRFVILDCVAREPVPGAAKGVGSDAVLWDSTLLWLTENLKKDQPTVILSHHPLVTPEGGFSPWEIDDINDAIESSGADVQANFAGHVHGFYDPSTSWRPWLPYPVGNPSFMDANTIYAGLGVPAGVPAITTEALMVASNDPISKGIVRIVEAERSQITIPLEVQGEFPALNPYFKQVDVELQPALGWPPFKWVIEVEAYAFTKLFSEEHPGTYTLYIDGEEVGSVQSVSWLNAVEFEHEYQGDKFYNFNLTVEGYELPWSESISQTRYLCRPDLLFAVFSPVDITVIDPDGLTISKQLDQIPGATYIEEDFNGDGNPDDVITIPDRKIGDYLITVIPEPDASPSDTYSLMISAAGMSMVLAENVQLSDIPSQGYIVRSTETEIIQIIPATIDFDPDILNLRSEGKVVTVYIELPTCYDVSKIDVSSITLNGTVPALDKPTKVGDYDRDGVPDLMVKFDGAAVEDLLTLGSQVEITITGEVAGIGFEGSDTIRVIGGSYGKILASVILAFAWGASQ